MDRVPLPALGPARAVQATLDRVLGRPLRTVNAIINGKKEITPRAAVELATAFGTSPEFWLNLEMSYRPSLVGEPDPEIAERARELAST